MKRMAWFGVGLILAATGAQAEMPPPETSLAEIQTLLNSGRTTARELTEGYRQRIAQLDRAGPKLNAVIELNSDALTIADQLDAERKEGHVRGPLHGIPILIKDNIATADRMETTAGSLAMVGSKPREDAVIVQRLRAAGAVILGKTNLSEWANFRSNHATSGWSSRGGLTRNPYVLDRSASGSSSGSAVAVSAGLCAAAIGTETDGSIVSPAGINGIVGFKPTVGWVSRAGIIPISASQDTAGPMTRTVHDAAIMLEVLATPEFSPTVGLPVPAFHQVPVERDLKPGALRGARIGIWRKTSSYQPSITPVFEASLTVMRAAGAELVDPVEMPSTREVDEAESVVLRFEFKSGVNAYLATLKPDAKMKSLADIIAFNRDNRRSAMPLFEQEILEQAEQCGALTDKNYLAARAACVRLARTDGIDALMDREHLDAIVAVTNGPSWVVDPVKGDRFTGGSATPAAVAGYPNITVPAGEVGGLPMGISFMGRAWSDRKLLGYAADFEERAPRRRAPTFLETSSPP